MACLAGNAMAIAEAEALQGEVPKRFEENGVAVHVDSDEMLKGFYDTTKQAMERRSAENEMFGKVYASMMALRGSSVMFSAPVGGG